MIEGKIRIKEKYMFESIYDSLVEEKLRNFDKDTDILLNGLSAHGNAFINNRRIEKKYKEYLKEQIRDISQTLLIVDINEQREGVFEFSDLHPNSQYVQYIDRFFERSYYEKFISKYKLWHEKVHRIMDLGYAYLLEIIKNYLKDIERLEEKELIKKANEYVLNDLVFLGDKHNGAKSVVKCNINNDYVMYKPENGRIYELYGKMIRLISGDVGYKILSLVQGNKYFWCECVSNESCQKESEIKAYYKNAGIMLATSYIMNSVDIHNENILAVGKYPVVIDAETVASMDIFSKRATKGRKLLEKSVFKTSIIPMNYDKRNEGVMDCSALGEEIIVEKTESEIIDEFTSEAKQKRVKRKYKDIDTHLPKLGNKSIPAWEYVKDILDGFDEGYENIKKNRSKIYNLLKDYENTKIRIVLRSTLVYSEIMKRLNFPDLLKDKETAKEFIRYIFRNNNIDDYLLKHEMRQLLSGDVPYFTTLLKDRTVYTEEWERALRKRYKSPIECVLDKLDVVSDEDKEHQLNYIKISFNYEGCNFASFIGKDLAEMEKEVIAYRNRLKVYNGDYLCFFSLQKNWKGQYSYDEMNTGIYEGYLGLALYDEDNDMLLKKNDIIRVLEKVKRNHRWGIIDGYAGALLYLKNDRILDELDRKEKISDMLSNMEERIPCEISENKVDLIEGISGTIVALSHYTNDDCNEKKRAIDLIEKLSNLITNLWDIKSSIMTKVTGFAHGIAGIKAAMYIAYCITDNKKYLDQYKKMEKIDDVHDYVTLNWCNGVVGYYAAYYLVYRFAGIIGMADKKTNLAFKEYIEDKLKEGTNYIIDNVMNTNDFCLCHGFFSALDFLMTLDKAGFLNEMQKERYKMAMDMAIERLRKDKVCILDISLFTGITGISYMYQRQTKEIPSILTYLY